MLKLNTLWANYGKSRTAVFHLLLSALVSAFLLGGSIGCNKGDTDGGKGGDDAGIGQQYVSDGGAGGSLKITIEGDLRVADTVPFRVTVTDPDGEPIAFVRIFCESEAGIAIIEPSRGGVAFEHTSARGIMSGVLGGVTPGSYLFECRAEQGFNLVDRVSIIITGEVPSDFIGFPGAAGGNLGGGRLIEDPITDDPLVGAITFVDVIGDETPTGFIDIVFTPDCDGVVATSDPEPFGPDDYIIQLRNPLPTTLTISSLRFRVNDGSGATSLSEATGTTVPAGSLGGAFGTATVQNRFTDFAGGGAVKTFAGTTVPVTTGTYTVTFTITLRRSDTGESFTIRDGATYTADGFNNCE